MRSGVGRRTVKVFREHDRLSSPTVLFLISFVSLFFLDVSIPLILSFPLTFSFMYFLISFRNNFYGRLIRSRHSGDSNAIKRRILTLEPAWDTQGKWSCFSLYALQVSFSYYKRIVQVFVCISRWLLPNTCQLVPEWTWGLIHSEIFWDISGFLLM